MVRIANMEWEAENKFIVLHGVMYCMQGKMELEGSVTGHCLSVVLNLMKNRIHSHCYLDCIANSGNCMTTAQLYIFIKKWVKHVMCMISPLFIVCKIHARKFMTSCDNYYSCKLKIHEAKLISSINFR